MTTTIEPHSESASTNISTDLEELWRSQFFAAQGQTPVGAIPDVKTSEARNSLMHMTATVRFSGGAYDPVIVRFYEDIILQLQKQVVRYKTLWEETITAAAREEAEESYVARETVRPSDEVAKKLRSKTRSGFRLSVE